MATDTTEADNMVIDTTETAQAENMASNYFEVDKKDN